MANKDIKRDTTVVVISGEHKGQRGTVLHVDREKQRVTIEGVNVRNKARRRTQENPEGGFIEKEMPIHISNVMAADRYDAKHANTSQ